MNSMSRVTLNLVTLSSVGLGGWYLGKFSERKRCSNEKDNGTIKFSKARICNMPALPLFGTVTAATPLTPVENKPEMGSKISSTAARISQIMKFGFPGLDHVRSYEDFVLSYDRRNKVAHWVFEHLTKDRLQYKDSVDRSKCEFKPDQSIHPFFRSENTDYKGSGYDRGHLAAAGNHKVEQKHMEQTFFLSNMAPQVGVGFNRDSWNRLEKYVRKLTNIYKDVYVCTGPLYLPKKEADGKKYVRYEVIGVNNVAVPTHFYKVIVGETKEGKLEMEAFVMPNMPVNDNTPLTNFQVPPETIERAAGLLFFDKISRDKLSKVNGKNTG
ncbi:PREDICTED: endonuclease G, mitochondrial isoform X1 [Dinoponera quadriceps]|uniref:Endonuclease n=1 Tax=Dinoponera quadriceps TaxID=609295 RepID=A0A6P3XW38_DINQU|nr:PREDICTED: endonuclease G, mitochondrial isoform X1 [Dinoponera quadriceps]XP_014482761.1 PREDICTED: endonuclease G, mitochondrial isoform X1 [Dinoponera quadriceps]